MQAHLAINLNAKGREVAAAADSVAVRTAAGVVIGTDVQAFDSALTNWAAKAIPTGVVVGDTGTQTLMNKTLTSPVITNIVPGADFTLTQNAVIPLTSVNSGAVANTLYLKAGNVGIRTTAPATVLAVKNTTDGTTNPFQVLNSQGNLIYESNVNASGQGLFGICDNGTRKIQFYAGGNSYINAGSLGIGKATPPSTALDVVGAIQASTYIKPGSFTVATLPSASTSGAGATVWCSDASGGATLVTSNGSVWKLAGTQTTVS